MDCPTDRILDYCSDKPDPEFERHLESCGACRKLVAGQRALWQTLDQWTPPEVSLDFDRKLYAKITAEQQAAPWWRFLTSPVAAVSLAVAALVLALGLYVRKPPVVHTDKVDIEQVEQTLDDLEILAPAS